MIRLGHQGHIIIFMIFLFAKMDILKYTLIYRVCGGPQVLSKGQVAQTGSGPASVLRRVVSARQSWVTVTRLGSEKWSQCLGGGAGHGNAGRVKILEHIFKIKFI